MKGKILVTGTEFHKDQIDRLESSGYELELLNTQNPTEEELIDHLKGKIAYILRGMDKVTDQVINSTDMLKAIAFSGTDWRALIPAWEQATAKGIAITNARGGNSYAVAEFSMAVALAMQRNLFEIGSSSSKVSMRTPTLKDSIVGVIGAGAIGQKIIAQAKPFGPSKILYYSRSKKDCGAEYVSFDELLSKSDIIFVAVPGNAGQLINDHAIAEIKKRALLVSISPLNLIDYGALIIRLQAGEIRAAIDFPAPDARYASLPSHIWFNSNSHTAYNTDQAARHCSEMAVESLLNILNTGKDQYLVNPDYKKVKT